MLLNKTIFTHLRFANKKMIPIIAYRQIKARQFTAQKLSESSNNCKLNAGLLIVADWAFESAARREFVVHVLAEIYPTD